MYMYMLSNITWRAWAANKLVYREIDGIFVDTISVCTRTEKRFLLMLTNKLAVLSPHTNRVHVNLHIRSCKDNENKGRVKKRGVVDTPTAA